MVAKIGKYATFSKSELVGLLTSRDGLLAVRERMYFDIKAENRLLKRKIEKLENNRQVLMQKLSAMRTANPSAAGGTK